MKAKSNDLRHSVSGLAAHIQLYHKQHEGCRLLTSGSEICSTKVTVSEIRSINLGAIQSKRHEAILLGYIVLSSTRKSHDSCDSHDVSTM